MNKFSIIIPFYNNLTCLKLQLNEFVRYKNMWDQIEIILIDDHSDREQLPNEYILKTIRQAKTPKDKIRLFRVLDDIKWNQHGCRNLGARRATYPWLIMIDVDHVLPSESLNALVHKKLDDKCYYKPRGLTPFNEPVEKIHKNQYICTKKAYWLSGGYNELFSGTYGGDQEFLSLLRKRCELVILNDIKLIYYVGQKYRTQGLDRKSDYQKFLKVKDQLKKRRMIQSCISDSVRFTWKEVAL
jgi:glycosyltransferase involved in cell wall biosynthesis